MGSNPIGGTQFPRNSRDTLPRYGAGAVEPASGMAGTSAWIGGMLFTLLIGQSADLFGYNPLFVALAGLDLLAAVVLWGLLKSDGGKATV